MHSLVGSRSNFVEQHHPQHQLSEVVLQGYHKKLKTMKKKYFVLYSETPSSAARLEYYDSEKKFKSRSNPKKTIILKNCFNINRRLDTKHKYVIALSVRDGGFCIVMDSEEELNKWLKALLVLQRGEDTESEMPKPTFEHVWQVQVQRKGLAEEKGLLGNYHVCLTSKSLTLYRIGSPKTNQGESRLYSVEFDLTTIRRCGDSQCYFYMEVGRHSAIGAGELWMETEDTLIAQNMHTMIINAMSSMRNRDELGPMRKRSSSETSKTGSGSTIQRRQTTTGIRPINSSPQTNILLLRDRCDSLPTRNRTISECSNQSNSTTTSMPPPKTIPINRPHSMYTNRHSHSPPVNSALSPSTGCSESEGSSLSIDEPDSLLEHSSLTPDESGNFVSHYFNSLSSRVTIPEEKDEWYPDNKGSLINGMEIPYIDKLNNHGGLSLPLHSNQLRKGSPAMNSRTGSIDMQSQYMDMCSPYSPCGSSPCDQLGGGYIPISPSVEGNRGLYTGSSGGHSRASSLAEETVDGYVPMCPPNQPIPAEEYVDMEQSIKQNNANNIPSGFNSAASSSSITSGTPSTDLKFAEYPLEKVASRFTPDDEDMQCISDRPTRAYSVGSRVEHNKRKLRVEFNSEPQNNSRVRAFSVGSRAKVPRCDLSRGVLQYNLMTNHLNTANLNLNNNNIDISGISSKQRNNKSSSAPLLIHKNHSSVERMSDLMEIDFSKNSADNSSSSSGGGGSRRNLVDMSSSFNTNTQQSSSKASRISSIPVTVPFSSSTKSNSSFSKATPPGYLEMRPGSYPENNCFSSSSPLSSMTKFEGSNNSNIVNRGYLEMKPVNISKSPSLSSSPSKSIYSPKYSAKIQQQKHPVLAKEMNTSQINSNNNNKTVHYIQNDYINISPASMEFSPSINSNNISTIKENDKSMDIDPIPTTPDGYVPMNRSISKTDNQFWINRSTSMPIDIKNANQQAKNKYSLDLDHSTSAISQHDLQNNSQQHNIELGGSSESSLCNQNTMFSLSPCSPQKTFDSNQSINSNIIAAARKNSLSNSAERKCLVDASNGTVTLLDNHQDSQNQKIASSLHSLQHLNNKTNTSKEVLFMDNEKDSSSKNIESFLCDYTDMSLNIGEKQQQANKIHSKQNQNEIRLLKKMPSVSEVQPDQLLLEHDYINYNPSSTSQTVVKQTTTIGNINKNSNTDKPTIITSNLTLTTLTTKKFPIKDKSSIGPFEGFKPIVNDEMNNNGNNQVTNNNNNVNYNNNILKKSPRSTSIVTLSKNNQNLSSGAYELLRCDSTPMQPTQQPLQINKYSLSRPNSVNSEKISPLKNTPANQIRPNSANSDSLTSPVSNSSSTSTLCGGSSSTSSSSTLCGSKSQSPLTSSRPQSFSDGVNVSKTLFEIKRADSNSSAETISSITQSSSTTSTNTGISGNSGSNVLSTASNLHTTTTTTTTTTNLITSRPPSVASEKELHYASLDLPPSSTTPIPTTTSASSSSISEATITKINSSTSGDSSTSPSPNASCSTQQPAFAYAQIDFKKSSSTESGSGGSGSNCSSGGGSAGSCGSVVSKVVITDQKSSNQTIPDKNI